MVFVNTRHFGTSIRNESVSSQDVATAQSPIRGAKYSQEKKSDFLGYYYELQDPAL